MAYRDPDKQSDWDDFRADDWHGFDRSTWSYRYDHRYDDGEGGGSGGGCGCGCGVVLTIVICFVISMILEGTSVLDLESPDSGGVFYVILVISAFISWKIIKYQVEISFFFGKLVSIGFIILIILFILGFLQSLFETVP